MPERYDAVLVHVYMFKQPREGRAIRSSLRGHMQVSAIANLYQEGRVGKIFIAGGKVWGEQYPSLAEVMSQELQKRSIPQEDIVIHDEAKDTPKEVDLFLDRAKTENWRNLASIANKTHLRRIKNIYTRRREDVKSIATEDVLQDFEYRNKYPYRPFLRRFKFSKMEIIFNFRESAVWFLYKLGLEKIATNFAQSNRVQQFKVPFDS